MSTGFRLLLIVGSVFFLTDGGNRQIAAKPLGRIGDPAALTDLINVLHDRKTPTFERSGAALGIGAWCASVDASAKDTAAEDLAFNSLVEVLNCRAEPLILRMATVRALGESGDQRAVPVLIAVANERRTLKMAFWAAIGVVKLTDGAVPDVGVAKVIWDYHPVGEVCGEEIDAKADAIERMRVQGVTPSRIIARVVVIGSLLFLAAVTLVFIFRQWWRRREQRLPEGGVSQDRCTPRLQILIGFPGTARRRWLVRSLVAVVGVVAVWGLAQLVVSGYRSVREANRQAACRENMKQLGQWLLDYSSEHKQYPTYMDPRAPEGQPTSWRVQMLPYLKEGSRYEDYDPNQPWDSPANIGLGDPMPTAYRCPSHASPNPLETDYLAIVGPKALLRERKAAAENDITDGTVHTMVFFESYPSGIHWMKPVDAKVEDFALFQPFPLRSAHPGICNTFFADGSVRTISDEIDPTLLEAAATANGGEQVFDVIIE